MSLRAPASSFVSVGWKLSEFPWRSSLRSSLPTGVPASEWVQEFVASSYNFVVPSAFRKTKNVHPFVASMLHSYWFSEDGFLTRPNFPAPRCVRPKYLLSQFSRNKCVLKECSKLDILTKLMAPCLIFFSFFYCCFSRFWAAFPILDHTSSYTWSGLVVDHINPLGGISFNNVKFLKPFHECDKLLFESTFPIVINAFFFHHVQICVSEPRNKNIFQLNRECFFFRHTSWNRWSLWWR